jgi:hypothetical protein
VFSIDAAREPNTHKAPQFRLELVAQGLIHRMKPGETRMDQSHFPYFDERSARTLITFS